jgi:small subunit ribosomal protein S17
MADEATAANAANKHRNSKVGLVVSHSGNKTIVVEVTRRVQHPLYKRYINKNKKFYAHDEKNEAQPGDRVRIVETRPLSALKRWRLVEIVLRGSGLPPVSDLADAVVAPPEEAAS